MSVVSHTNTYAILVFQIIEFSSRLLRPTLGVSEMHSHIPVHLRIKWRLLYEVRRRISSKGCRSIAFGSMGQRRDGVDLVIVPALHQGPYVSDRY